MSEASRTKGPLGRGLVLSIALVIALGGLVAACGGDDDEEPSGTEMTEETTEPPDEPTDGEDGAGDGDGAGDATAGQQVFADNCATCHGDQGEGTEQAPSLQDSSTAADAGAVEEQVREGGGGMPPFEGQLSDQEIADVTAYVTGDIAGQ